MNFTDPGLYHVFQLFTSVGLQLIHINYLISAGKRINENLFDTIFSDHLVLETIFWSFGKIDYSNIDLSVILQVIYSVEWLRV